VRIGKTPLPDPPLYSAKYRPPSRQKTRGWRAALLAATSLAVACGLAAAPASAAGTPAGIRTAAGSRVQYIGAFVGAVGHQAGRAAQWNKAYNEIGPLQSDKIFYGTGTGVAPLPASFKGSVCDELKHTPVCVIAYKTATKKTVQSFVESMPAHRSQPVIMVYWDEPELESSGISPATYKKEFDLRSQWVRQAAQAKNLTYVKVAMDSATSGYAPGKPGAGCAYLPSANYVDYYLTDVYDYTLVGLQNVAGFQQWLKCTANEGKPRGFAEYGLGHCTASGGQATPKERETTLSNDAAWLTKNLPHLFLWEYWYSKIEGSPGPCKGSWFPADSVIATEWEKIEAGTVES
jgi:hypothetical protein